MNGICPNYMGKEKEDDWHLVPQPIRRVEPVTTTPPADPDYGALYRVLMMAYARAATGKGKERHAYPGEPFEEQTIAKALETFGEHAWDGQVAKKMLEADRLPPEAGDNELADCINYIAARILVRQRGRK